MDMYIDDIRISGSNQTPDYPELVYQIERFGNGNQSTVYDRLGPDSGFSALARFLSQASSTKEVLKSI